MKKTQIEEQETEKLVDHIVEGIREKKGHDIVTLNLSKLNNAVCDYFVICHGNSDTQVEAIADSVEDYVKKKTNAKPIHVEGVENAEWILLDYFDVVVHIFLKDKRPFYQLEEVWADATANSLEDIY